jgi:LuxR family maltose regulon positive regulatory protein
MLDGPKIPPHAVARPVLYERLDSALTRPLTLVVAPAGSGKSVLLSQWVATRDELNVVWIDVVPADSDPAHFARRLLHALAATRPSMLELLQLLRISDGALGAPLLDAVVSELESFPQSVIVLDDLHLLANSTLQSELAHLVSSFPPDIHAIFASRVDLPLASPRRRLTLDVPELRSAELAFSRSESEWLIHSITGRELAPADIDILVERTEGWAAGLQLAALSVRFHGGENGYVEELAGTNRLIADYLTEEVLRGQSPRRRTALLQLSVLDEVSSSLITQLTDYKNGQELLDELERESLFIIALDHHREWYRFHHLFRDVLRYRLRAEDSAAEAELLKIAANWNLGRGNSSTAAEYLIRAKDWGALEKVILDQGSEMFERGELATVIRWINTLPPTFRSERMPDVKLLLGLLHTLNGASASAEEILRAIAADPSSSIGQRAIAMSFISALVQFRSPVEISTEFGIRALALLDLHPDEPIPSLMGLTGRRLLITQALGSVARSYFFGGDMPRAREWASRTEQSDGATYPVFRIHLLGTLAFMDSLDGYLTRAEDLANQALDVATEFSLLSHPAPADAFFALARVATDRGEPGKAALWNHEGATRASSNHRTQTMWMGHLASLGGDHQPPPVTESISGAPPAIVRDGLLAFRARSARLANDNDDAWRMLQGSHSGSHRLAIERIATALAQGNLQTARKTIETLSAGAETSKRTAIEILALRARLAELEGASSSAEALMRNALELAEPEMFVEALVGLGPEVVRLMQATRSNSDFAKLVSVRARESLRPHNAETQLVQFTDREQEILTHLPTRMSNSEIAACYFLSVNTVKTHMAHIYQKLNATSRDGAIVRARELGML